MRRYCFVDLFFIEDNFIEIGKIKYPKDVRFDYPYISFSRRAVTLAKNPGERTNLRYSERHFFKIEKYN